MILTDTSVWIDHLRGSRTPQTGILERHLADPDELILSGLVLTEVLLGVRDDTQAAAVRSMLGNQEMTPDLRRRDYEAAATIYRTCRARGYTLRSTIDCLIAQQCLRGGYTLLARDRDFSVIARFFPLRLAEPGHEIHEGGGSRGTDNPADRGQESTLTRRSASVSRRSSRASAPRRHATRR